MIRINLLTEPSAAKHAKKSLHLGPVLIIVAAVVVVGSAGGLAWKFRSMLVPKATTSNVKQYAVKKESAPSTYSQQYIVEDVVKEVSDANQKLTKSGVLALPYGELSFAEKINYEILFAKNVVELLGRAVPAGIGLRSFEADNFQTIYVVGLGSSKDMIQGMVTTLKNEHVEILPPPYSFIKPNDAKSFKFAFSCKLEFGLNLTDPVFDAPFKSNEDLVSQISAFEGFSKENGITITGRLKQVSSEKVGGYYRHSYEWRGTGTYKNFVKLIMRLYQADTKWAFKRISLIAQSGANLKIESQIILTTRE
jgi:hypothetical protein